MKESKDYYYLETEDGEKISIEVTWRVTYHQERHLVGDLVAWARHHKYEVEQVRRTDTDDVYEPYYDDAHEDWHYLFDGAYIKGDIQAG